VLFFPKLTSLLAALNNLTHRIKRASQVVKNLLFKMSSTSLYKIIRKSPKKSIVHFADISVVWTALRVE
jgi:hypothetical protein